MPASFTNAATSKTTTQEQTPPPSPFLKGCPTIQPLSPLAKTSRNRTALVALDLTELRQPLFDLKTRTTIFGRDLWGCGTCPLDRGETATRVHLPSWSFPYTLHICTSFNPPHCIRPDFVRTRGLLNQHVRRARKREQVP